MGDDERAEVGREHRTAPFPLEVDPELTPPPREPPDITATPGFDELDPATREPILALHHAQRELDVAVSKLWDVRKVPEQLAALQATVAVLAERSRDIASFQAAVNQHAGQLYRLAVAVEGRREIDARMTAALEQLNDRLHEMQESYARDKATADSAIAQTKSEAAELAAEIKTEATERKAGDLALDGRVRSLEDSRTQARGAMRAVYLVAGLIGFLVGLVVHFFGSARK